MRLSGDTPPAGEALCRIVVVEDDPVRRGEIAAVLAPDSALEVVATAASAEEGCTRVEQLCPEIVILDLQTADAEVIETCARLVERTPGVHVIVLTRSDDERVMLASFAAGARGFVASGSGPKTLLLAVRAVAGGGTFVDASAAATLVALAARRRRARGPYGLTPMEMRVVERLPRGLTNAQIADELSVQPETVKTYVRSALRKMRVSDRAEAAALAVREGLA